MKYRITLTEQQAKVVAEACEFFARVRCGQFAEIRWKTLDLSLPVDDYCERRDRMDAILLAARAEAYPELHGAGHSYGLGKFEDADIAFDVYQVIRAVFGDPRGAWSVRELPTCDEIEE